MRGRLGIRFKDSDAFPADEPLAMRASSCLTPPVIDGHPHVIGTLRACACAPASPVEMDPPMPRSQTEPERYLDVEMPDRIDPGRAGERPLSWGVRAATAPPNGCSTHAGNRELRPSRSKGGHNSRAS
jgi:hypothetical protein